MKIIEGRREHAEGILDVRRIVRADTYADDASGATREFYLNYNEVTPQRIDYEIAQIESETTGYWVAEEASSVIGYLKACRIPRQRIEMVHILQAHRGRGIGSELLQQALDWLDLSQPVYLEVVVGNDRALEWYQRLGWRLTGRLLNGTPLPDGTFVPEHELVLDPV